MAKTVLFKRGDETVVRTKSEIISLIGAAGPLVRSTVEVVGRGSVEVERYGSDEPWSITFWTVNGRLYKTFTFYTAMSVATIICRFDDGEL